MGLAYQQFNFEGRNQTKLKEASIGDVIYKIINPSLSVSFGNVFGSQLSIFGDMAQNIQSDLPKVDDKDADKGYLAGISFGDSKINGFGKWNIKAMYRYLEAYAIPEKLGDSDAYGGKAGKGYEVVLSLGLGALMGYLFTFSERFFHSRSKRLSMSVAFVFLTVAISMQIFIQTVNI